MCAGYLDLDLDPVLCADYLELDLDPVLCADYLDGKTSATQFSPVKVSLRTFSFISKLSK